MSSTGPAFTGIPTPGFARILHWNDSWVVALDRFVARFGLDGDKLVDFHEYFDTSTEDGSNPYFAITGDGLLVAYSGRPLDNSDTHARIVLLDDALAVKAGPFDVGPGKSYIAGLAPDGSAVSWYQAYGSDLEGYRFSLLTPPMDVGTPDVLTTDFDSTFAAEIVRGANEFYVFYRDGCTSVQRYDAARERVGDATKLEPAGLPCPDDTNLYAIRSPDHAVSANGAHCVSFGEFGANDGIPWAGAAVIDDATGVVRGIQTFPDAGALSAGVPTVAAFDGQFALAWSTTENRANTPQTGHLVLIDAGGTQASAVLTLPQPSSKYLAPIVTASPDGFVVFTVTVDDESSRTYTALNVTCE